MLLSVSIECLDTTAICLMLISRLWIRYRGSLRAHGLSHPSRESAPPARVVEARSLASTTSFLACVACEFEGFLTVDDDCAPILGDGAVDDALALDALGRWLAATEDFADTLDSIGIFVAV